MEQGGIDRLVIAIHGGDEEAFVAFQMLWQPAVLAEVRGFRLSPADEAELLSDIDEQITAQLYQSLRRIKHPPSWAGQIARRRGSRFVRRLAVRRRWTRSTPAPEELVDPADDINHLLAATEIQRRQHNWSREQKLAVRLFTDSGMTYAEIADEMDSTRDAVRGLIRRAQGRC